MTISSVCLIILRALFCGFPPPQCRLGVESIRGGCAQTAQQLSFLIFPKFVMPV